MRTNESVNEEHRLAGEFAGFLDTPQPDQVVMDQALTVRGWVFGVERPLQRLFLRRRRAPQADITSGLPRPDVGNAYPAHAGAEASGFEARIELAGARSGPCTFDI